MLSRRVLPDKTTRCMCVCVCVCVCDSRPVVEKGDHPCVISPDLHLKERTFRSGEIAACIRRFASYLPLQIDRCCKGFFFREGRSLVWVAGACYWVRGWFSNEERDLKYVIGLRILFIIYYCTPFPCFNRLIKITSIGSSKII